MTVFTTTFPTPFGPFSAAVDPTGAVVATAFGDEDALRQRLPKSTPVQCVPDEHKTQAVREQVLAYARGEQIQFHLPLSPVGSAFQKRVWAALAQIPAGESRSYGDLAATLRTAPRAVGRANALNPICLIVPCHRVIGKDGTLTGFAFGTALKQRLLDHERELVMAGV